MEILQDIFQTQIILRLGWTLIHLVWQATVVAMVLAIVLKLLKKSSSNVRYITACIALALIVLIPAVTMRMVNISVPGLDLLKLKQAGFDLSEVGATTQAGIEMSQIELPPAQVAATPKISLKGKFAQTIEPVLPHIVVVWLVGVFGMSLWHLGGWTQLQRLRRQMTKEAAPSLYAKLQQLSKMLGITKTIGLVESALVQVPTVVGHLKPVILLPASALIGLSPEQIEAILAHELAHIKRFDYLVNILQTVVEILGFYIPAVLWISHKIRIERENCCDDIAVSLCHDSLCYARALTTMEEIRASQPAFAIAASGGSLFDRIRRLVLRNNRAPEKFNWLIPALAIFLMTSVLVLISCQRSQSKADIGSTIVKSVYSSVTIEEGVGFEDIILGNDNCTGEFIKSKLGKPDKEVKNQENWWLNYRKTYGLDFWVNRQENIMLEIRLNKGFKGKLTSGISMSSSRQEVFDVYGKPVSEPAVNNLHGKYDDKVLYKQKLTLGISSRISYKQHGLSFWFVGDKPKQIVLSRAESSDSADGSRKLTDAQLPETSIINEDGHIVDKTDYPFVNDPEVIGGWKSVDFVEDIDQFDPTDQNWKDDLFLNNLIFEEKGSIAGNFMTWTKGLVLSDDTASKYSIIEIAGSTYMFFEWKSGDYTVRHSKPSYYVLKKVLTESLRYEPMFGKKANIPPTSTINELGHIIDKTDYPFVNDSQVIGTWKSVDFVDEIQQFKIDEQQWPGECDLFLNEIVFGENGRLLSKNVKSPRGYTGTWTNGLVLGDDTASKYILKDMDGSTYMFYEWKSGDYTYRYRKPSYYVLKKVSSETGDFGEVWGSQPSDAEFSRQLPERIEQLDIDTADLEQVKDIFGLPAEYIWGKETFTEDNLPRQYILVYPSRFRIFMRENEIVELRCESGFNYVFRDKIRSGSTLDEVFEVVGHPEKTVEGEKNLFEDGVLYKDIDGEKGYCYYARSDQDVRLWFLDYKIHAIYMTCSDYGTWVAPKKGYLGLELNNKTWPIINVLPQMPAAQAGMQNGDKLLKVNDKDMSHITTIRGALAVLNGQPGEKVKLTVQRGEEILSFEVERTKNLKEISANKSQEQIIQGQIIQKKLAEVHSDPQIIHDAAYNIFEKIKDADYDQFLGADCANWGQFPIVEYYNSYRDYPELVRWICTTFKENPIDSIELGNVSFTESWPRIYYKLTLKDGAILEGDLHFEYPFYHSDGGRWHAIHGHFYDGPRTPYETHGLDWHLQENPIKKPQAQLTDSSSVPQVITSGYFLSVPVDMPQLKDILSDDKSKGKMITPQELQEFLDVVRNTPQARIISSPKVIANDGEGAEITTEDAEGFESIKLNIKNTVGNDKKTVKLELDFEYSVSVGQDVSSTSTSTTATVLSDHAIAVAGSTPINGQRVLLLVKPQVLEKTFSKTGVVAGDAMEGEIFLIPNIDFEPIHQGKNVVWITVENKSDKSEFFGVNVYSRSVDYGPQGIGWGTTFYERFDAGQTKKLRYVYKVQGPVTKNTYTRLWFYNAKSLEHKDNKDLKPFAKKQYSITDLKLYPSDKAQMSTASQEQFEAVSQAFIEIQQYIHRGNYENVWDLFTEDHKKAEYQSRGLEAFKRQMEPNHKLDSAFIWEKDDFLSLKPQKAVRIKSEDVCTLIAVTDSQQWQIDFVKQADQWKIDWIAGYTPRIVQNWEERQLRKMEKYSSEHFGIYYEKGSPAEKDIEKIANDRDRSFEKICEFLGTEFDKQIKLILFEDRKTKLFETGHQGDGWSYDNTIVEVYNEETQLDAFTSTSYILKGNLGDPPALFNYGFSLYMVEQLGNKALKNLGGGDMSLYQRAKQLKEQGQWIPLAELITYTDIGPAESKPSISYAEAGAFSKFLIDTFGRDKFLQAYAQLKNSEDKTIQQQNIELFEQIHGKKLHQIEQEWQAIATKPSKQHFQTH